MAIERARAWLCGFGFEGRIREFDVSSATVALAAEAAGVIPARIAKSMAFMMPEGPILVLAAGDARVDNPKFKAQFHAKARMIGREDLEPLIGHAMGGVCPFGIEPGVRTFLDVSLKRFDTVLPACGSDNSAVELSCDELERAAQGFTGWVDVCRLA